MKIMAGVITGFGALALSGCAAFTSPARMHELDKDQAYWFDYTSDRRGTLMIPKGKGVITCSEPSPDTAMDVVSKLGLTAELPGGQGTVEASSQVKQEVVQLAKRTQMVMFLRESLYRLCEISANNGLSPAQVVAQYDQVIKAALELAKVEVAQAQATAAKAEASAAKAKEDASKAQLELLKFRKDTGTAIDAVE